MSSMVHSLVYVSVASRPVSGVELATMMRKARVFNEAHQITGLLLYQQGRFMQALEGPMEQVRNVYDNVISRDPRHRDCRIILERAIPKRAFPDWRMGFQDLTGLTDADLSIYTDFANWNPRLREESYRLLMQFRNARSVSAA